MNESRFYKGKDPYVFVRFGGLSIKKQKGIGSKNYHSPPAGRGIYAMPKIAIEMFLVGSIDKYQPGTMKSDKNMKTYDDYMKSQDRALQLIRREFRKDKGTIWHHLGDFCNNNQIIDSNGTWVKTSMRDWGKAFSKMSMKLRYGDSKYDPPTKSINDVRGLTGYYSKDHCEVFFDEKV